MMDIYTHAQDDAKRKALEKFEARFSKRQAENHKWKIGEDRSRRPFCANLP
jgi:hypothetical protein